MATYSVLQLGEDGDVRRPRREDVAWARGQRGDIADLLQQGKTTVVSGGAGE